MSKYAITKVGVSPKRVYKISNGETPGKRGRQAKFNQEHKDYVITLAISDPYITNKDIRSHYSTKFRRFCFVRTGF